LSFVKLYIFQPSELAANGCSRVVSEDQGRARAHPGSGRVQARSGSSGRKGGAKNKSTLTLAPGSNLHN
jgi:hypothetical protein